MKIEKEQHRIIISKAQNPFDDLAKDAIRGYKQGRTETIEEFAIEQNLYLYRSIQCLKMKPLITKRNSEATR